MTVTDHALIRWLERAHGIDMTEMRRQLDVLAKPYADARVKHAFVGGVWFVFKSGALVTVLDEKPDMKSTAGNDRGSVNGGDQDWRCDPNMVRRRKMKKQRRR